MTIPDLFQRDTSRRAVLEQYATAHDAWSEREQLAALEGDAAMVEECHRNAVIALNAYRLELDNPTPRDAA